MLTNGLQNRQFAGRPHPKELAIVEAGQEIEIGKVGDAVVLSPLVRRKLTGTLARIWGEDKTVATESRPARQNTTRNENSKLEIL